MLSKQIQLFDDGEGGEAPLGYWMDSVAKLERVALAAKGVATRLELIQKAGPFGESPKWTKDLLEALEDAKHLLEKS